MVIGYHMSDLINIFKFCYSWPLMSLDDHELGKKVPLSMPVKFGTRSEYLECALPYEKVSFPKPNDKLHINNYFDKVKLIEKALNAPSPNKLFKKKSISRKSLSGDPKYLWSKQPNKTITIDGREVE